MIGSVGRGKMVWASGGLAGCAWALRAPCGPRVFTGRGRTRFWPKMGQTNRAQHHNTPTGGCDRVCWVLGGVHGTSGDPAGCVWNPLHHGPGMFIFEPPTFKIHPDTHTLVPRCGVYVTSERFLAPNTQCLNPLGHVTRWALKNPR